MKKGIIILILILGLVNVAYAANCGGRIQCSCGDTLTSSLVMTNDILDCSEKAITIGLDDLVLDCNGHEIDGEWFSDVEQYGIYISEFSGVTIKNCNIGDFFGEGNSGIYVGSDDNRIVDSNIFDNSVGVYLAGNNNIVSGNAIHHNSLEGLKLVDVSKNSISSNHIYSNDYGIGVFGDSFRNKIYNNEIEFQIVNGIFVSKASNNIFWGNEFSYNNEVHVFEDSLYGNNWDFLGLGNYWDDFTDNIGYPFVYVLPFPSSEVDHFPVLKVELEG